MTDLEQFTNVRERRRQGFVHRCQLTAVLFRQRHQIVVGDLFVAAQTTLGQGKVGGVVRPECVVDVLNEGAQNALSLGE